MQWHSYPGLETIPREHAWIYRVYGPRPKPETDTPGFGEQTPQGFLVEISQEAIPEVRVHYHPVDQFQYIANGDCEFARHEAGVGIVHYADANTAYGPIEPGAQGLAFYTLRAKTDTGAHYMPESRDALRAARQAESEVGTRQRNDSYDLLHAPAEADAWTELVHDADGLRVAIFESAAAGAVALPPVGGAGAYLIVVSGAIAVDGARLGAGALTWVDPGEEPGKVQSSEPGTRIGLCQLPAPAAARPRSASR